MSKPEDRPEDASGRESLEGAAVVSLRGAQKLHTRARIRRAARECFRKHGLANVSLEDIAERAGVSRGTVYFHYAGKDALLDDLIEHEWDGQARLYERLGRGVAAVRHLRIYRRLIQRR